MSRMLLIASLLVLPGFVFAAEPTKFVASIDTEFTLDGRTSKTHTDIAGEVNQPLNAEFAGANETKISVRIEKIAGEGAAQYKAEFRITQGKEVLTSPKIVVRRDQEGLITIGAEGKEMFKVAVKIREE